MKNFIRLGECDVLPALLQLDLHPDLWNQNDDRTTRSDKVHDVSDVWVRFRPRSELAGPETYSEKHFAVWYPAIDSLYELRPLIYSVMNRVNCVHLGGVLITKVPPGCKVRRHIDAGWHATYHNRKVYIPLKTNPQCLNTCDEETLVMQAGSVWTFNNLLLHSTENNGDDDRITLIISMRCD